MGHLDQLPGAAERQDSSTGRVRCGRDARWQSEAEKVASAG
jgi:hypothetical protein